MAGHISEILQKRQAEWMREWHIYLLRTHMRDTKNALEIGCGCGYVMKNLSLHIEVKGLDSNMESVRCASERGLTVYHGEGNHLPFPSDSFDLVYGNYLLLWNIKPEMILNEMIRVSRKYVALFAEPYWSGTVYDPPWLEGIVEKSKSVIKERGGNPDMGKKLSSLIYQFSNDFITGTVPLYVKHSDMRKMVEFEISVLGEKYNPNNKIYTFYIPTFWAIIKK